MSIHLSSISPVSRQGGCWKGQSGDQREAERQGCALGAMGKVVKSPRMPLRCRTSLALKGAAGAPRAGEEEGEGSEKGCSRVDAFSGSNDLWKMQRALRFLGWGWDGGWRWRWYFIPKSLVSSIPTTCEYIFTLETVWLLFVINLQKSKK